MATIAELKAALKETLDSRGVLGQLKARIRAEVFNALDDQSESKPPLSHENLLVNELIREYLEFNKYRYTASVLTAESGQPEVPLDRQFILNELNVTEDASARSVPLLYGMLAHFLQEKGERGNRILLRGPYLPPTRENASRKPTEKKRDVIRESSRKRKQRHAACTAGVSRKYKLTPGLVSARSSSRRSTVSDGQRRKFLEEEQIKSPSDKMNGPYKIFLSGHFYRS
ncbi:lisH domain-containing protein FOPNL isoform X1 [Erpetoichthys calabaricus]|uniref:lisH domain-containing protein FOPNL isoform X1 n=1 Tax=Erpetoichthys calabaricus TaxID=27687 RepID=UPI002234C411|nr:lisH domain-containing protein FOPNL isoform X1 [Erpetoichthys calabaricus]